MVPAVELSSANAKPTEIETAESKARIAMRAFFIWVFIKNNPAGIAALLFLWLKH